jgi:glycerophosphoryl diester phosphodiesterase
MTALPRIIAHRGDSSHAPENTLAAIRMAADRGAEGVEFDVRLSKDGVPMLIHDETLERTGGIRKEVAELTAEELSKINVGSWFNRKHPERADDRFRAEKIPTLQDVLELLNGFKGRIYVEMKCTPADMIALPKAVCSALKRLKDRERFVVKSFNLGSLPVVRSLLPDANIAALFDVGIESLLRRKSSIPFLSSEFCANEVSLHHALATPKLCRILKDSGMPITIWTVDKVSWLEKARKLGIGAVITNDPAKMLAARKG